MNKEAQRIAIAEACGWKMHTVAKDDPYTCTHCGIHYSPMIWRAWEIPYLWCNKNNETQPPNYLGDLNAMHEAEKALTSEQVTSYVYLLELMNDRWYTPAFATAPQRAEAFLSTIGKWEEAK
jgi:hypothetical protein